VSPYVFRNGQRIEVVEVDIGLAPKRRKLFKAQWVKLTPRWIEVLRHAKNKGTYQLALAILLEAFKRKHCGGEIVLSSAVTRMPRNTTMRAAKELVELGLIKTERKGRQAMRVSHISY
jgi:hypothetical protein